MPLSCCWISPCKHRCPASRAPTGQRWGDQAGCEGQVGGPGTGWDRAHPPCGVSMKEGFNNADLGSNNSLQPSHAGPVRAGRALQPRGPDGAPTAARPPAARRPPRLLGVSPAPPAWAGPHRRVPAAELAVPRLAEQEALQAHRVQLASTQPSDPRRPSPLPAPLPQLLAGADAEVRLRGEAGPGRPLRAAAGPREAAGGAGGSGRGTRRCRGTVP